MVNIGANSSNKYFLNHFSFIGHLFPQQMISHISYFKNLIFYRKTKPKAMEQDKENLPFSVKLANNNMKSHSNLTAKLTMNNSTQKIDNPFFIDRKAMTPCLQYSEDSISYEVQAEKQYVHRLRIQRQRIQALYGKYDKLLEQLSKKDKIIREQQKKLSELDRQCKSLSFMAPELEHFRAQHSQIIDENSLLKNNLSKLESHYNHLVNEFKNKSTFKNDERQQFTNRNEQLLERIKLITRKMQERQVERISQEKILKGKLQQLKSQLNQQKNKHFEELSEYRNELLQRNQQCHYLHLENQQLRQKLYELTEAFGMQKQMMLENINQVKKQKNTRLRACQLQISELSTQNELFHQNVNKLKQQCQKLAKQNQQLKQIGQEHRKINDQSLYELKVIIMEERSVHRENIMNYQSQLSRMETQLHSSMRKQQDLLRALKRIQISEGMKKQIRQIQKQEIDKINRLLI